MSEVGPRHPVIPSNLTCFVAELPSSVKISSPAVELVEGVGVTLECVVEGGHPQPKVVWLVNGTRLPSNGQYVS